MLLTASAALAQSPVEITEVRVGIGGDYKLGRLTPVEVTLQSKGETIQGVLQLTVADGDGVPVIYPPANGLPTQLIPGQAARVVSYVKFGQSVPELKLEFSMADRRPLTRTLYAEDLQTDVTFVTPATPDTLSILVVGRDLGIEELQRLYSNQHSLEVTNIADTATLPTRWYGYDSFDWVVLSTDDVELYRRMSPAQLEALEQWLNLGGKIFLPVSSTAPELLSPGEPLARFVPGDYADIVPQQGFAAGQISRLLESYSHSKRPIPNTEGDLVYGVEFSVPRIMNPRGNVLLEHEGLPLAIREHPGFGELVFVGLPLAQQPLSTWQGRTEVINRLMGTVATELDEDSYVSMWNDLATQVGSRLDQFSGIHFVSFWTIAFLVILYILLIGPVDYYLVRHVFKRMELTWVTFPCMVGLVSVGAYMAAYWLKGDELRLNRAEIVDYDLESGLVRGTAWLNLFSPQMDTYDLGIDPSLPGEDTVDLQRQLLWFSPPGGGLGGLGGQGSMFSRQYYAENQLSELVRVPIQVWSTKSFQGTWHGTITSEPVRASLRPTFGESVEGTIVNALDVPLRDCVLLVGPWALKLGDIQPGAEVTIDRRTDRQGVTGWLLGQSSRFADGEASVVVNFNAYSAYTISLLRVMGFYSAAGGEQRVQMSNAFSRWLDLSGQLSEERAILVASGPGTTPLVSTGEELPLVADEVTALYRVIIPLEPAAAIDVEAAQSDAAETPAANSLETNAARDVSSEVANPGSAAEEPANTDTDETTLEPAASDE